MTHGAMAAATGSMRGERDPSTDLIPSLRQAGVVALIIAATVLMAWVGLGAPARFFYMGCGLATALWYHRRCPWLYITLTFWFWTLTPFVRRLIDEHAGFDSINIILITPNLMAILMLGDMLKSRDLLRRRESLMGLMLLIPVLYGLAVSFVRGEVFAGAVGAADWFVPVLYFFYVIDKAYLVRQAGPHFSGFLTLNAIVVVGYGLLQFWNPPVWDVDWARSAAILSNADMQPGAFHVFSTLNVPGILAEWLGAIVLLSLYFRTALTPLILPLTAFLFFLTLNRSVAAGLGLSLVVAVLLGGSRTIRSLASMLLALAVASVFIMTLDSKVADSIVARFSSYTELQNDTSALTRASIWENAPGLIADNPVGMGIGALGRGAAVSGDADLISIDAGPLAIYLSLGWLAGTIYLFGMVMIVAAALFTSLLLKLPAPIACAAAALCSFLELAMVNIDGFAGAILWLCSGLAIAYGIEARSVLIGFSGSPQRLRRKVGSLSRME